LIAGTDPTVDEADKPWKPSREEIAAAGGKTVPDIIAPGLPVLFVGINPGLYSGAVAHHFARPGNRFWPLLHKAGFTPRLMTCFEERQLPALGIGITNFVERATAAASELAPDEVQAGAERLSDKIHRFGPAYVAFLGMQSYRIGFRRPKAGVGLQPETIGESKLWLLPNPSGLQAHYQMPELVELFGELRQASRQE
jgi:double-stranded uracil-DNA glycosylase